MDHLIGLARASAKIADPVVRQRLMRFWTELQLMRWNALRTMSNAVPGPEASISKLLWGTWHREMTNMMLDLLGPAALVGERAPYELGLEQRLALFSRSDTIYGGSNEVQRNVIGERSLGLAKEPSPR